MKRHVKSYSGRVVVRTFFEKLRLMMLTGATVSLFQIKMKKFGERRRSLEDEKKNCIGDNVNIAFGYHVLVLPSAT